LQRMRLYSGTVLVLSAVQLIESLATALPLSYFPNYVVGLGATVASVGLFTSSLMLASAIMSPRFGSLSDKYGRKKIMALRSKSEGGGGLIDICNADPVESKP